MFETLEFKNSVGDNLVGALHFSKRSKKAVVIAHGFTSNKDRSRHIRSANALQKAGITAFRIDFGGSGESDDREVTIKAEIDDLLSAIDLLKRKGFVKIGVLGESLGGMVSLKAYSPDFKAMVLWAPTTKAVDKFEFLEKDQIESVKKKGYFIKRKDGKDFKIPERYLEERKDFDRKKVLGGIKIPVMIVHGTADELLPVEDSEQAIKMLPKGSKLEIISNKGYDSHKMDKSMGVIIPKTVEWFRTYL